MKIGEPTPYSFLHRKLDGTADFPFLSSRAVYTMNIREGGAVWQQLTGLPREQAETLGIQQFETMEGLNDSPAFISWF